MHFSSLPSEKQSSVLDAALQAFGTHGFKKTSMADIASAAGISKSSIFYYFGSKKGLYLFLFDFCRQTIAQEIDAKSLLSSPDFLDRLRDVSHNKMDFLRRHPLVYSFLAKMYTEDNQAMAVVRKPAQKHIAWSIEALLEGADLSLLKEGVDPVLLTRLLFWAAQGALSGMERKNSIEAAEDFIQDFDNIILLFKKNFYKE